MDRPKNPDATLMSKALQRLPLALKSMGFSALRKGQDDVVFRLLMGLDVLCVIPTAGGKCLAKDTPVLLYSGKIVPVQDVRVGDRLAGPDGKPRLVTSLARGREEMFEVRPNYGDPYTVNRSHVLSLKLAPDPRNDGITVEGRRYHGGDVVAITVDSYLNQSCVFKLRARNWHAGTDFEERPPLPADLPPRLLGMWLGSRITSKGCNKNPEHHVVSLLESYGRKGESGHFIDALKAHGVWENKHIPEDYLLASRSDRMELLAGLLDADGRRKADGSFTIARKQESLVRDIVFLARSLGFRADYGSKLVTLSGTSWMGNQRYAVYYQVHLGGDLRSIPCRAAGKIPKDKVYKKNGLTSAFALVPKGVGDYYGFTLEGPDRLFLLGDFTVTHNTAAFVLPALCLDMRLLVFSPLKALIRDQVDGLRDKGIYAVSMSSSQQASENLDSLRSWTSGDSKIMYVAPERLSDDSFLSAMDKAPPGMVVVDECQCLSQWSDTFRASYRFIGGFLDRYNPRIVAAFTGTYNKWIGEDVRRVLNSPHMELCTYFPRRENLQLRSLPCPSTRDVVADILAGKGSTLIYCCTQKRVDQLAKSISEEIARKELEDEVLFYHAGWNDKIRDRNQDRFMQDKARIMVATNAFGLGVDKPNIRRVVHFDHPASPEALAQEIGRGGRDGLPTDCLTYYSKDASYFNSLLVNSNHPGEALVRKIFDRLLCEADSRGFFHVGPTELAKRLNEDQRKVSAALVALRGSHVIAPVEMAVVHKVALRGQGSGKQFVNFKEQLKKLGDPNGAWIEFDKGVIAGAMGVSVSYLGSLLSQWEKEEAVSVEAPPRGSPHKIRGTVDDVDFDRLEERRRLDFERMKVVESYVREVPDDQKHAFLEAYFSDNWKV